MNNIITRVKFSHLRNEVHVELHGTANTVIVKFSPDTLGIRKQYDAYKPALDEEVSLLDIVQKSGYTGEIEEQDIRRDTVFRGFADAAKSAGNHFDLDKRNAAERILIVLESYGNIASRPLDQETAAIDAMYREFSGGDYPPLIAQLGLNDWLAQLNLENQRFKELMLARYTEAAKRPTSSMRAARTKVDKAFQDIVATLEALVTINGIEAYEPFIKELNTVLERYKNILARQQK
jgi:hypothetical protein